MKAAIAMNIGDNGNGNNSNVEVEVGNEVEDPALEWKNLVELKKSEVGHVA